MRRLNSFMCEFEAAHIFYCVFRQCGCRCSQWRFPVYWCPNFFPASSSFSRNVAFWLRATPGVIL